MDKPHRRPDATKKFHDLSKDLWDVVIVGAGVSGAFLARQLSRAGLKTLLLDKADFPRYRVCGCAFSALAIEILKQAQMHPQQILAEGLPYVKQILCAGRWKATLKIPRGITIARQSLDTALVAEALRCGAHFSPNVRVTLTEAYRGGRKLTLAHQSQTETIRANLVVAACGLGSPFLRGIPGLKAAMEPESRIGIGTQIEIDKDICEPAAITTLCHGKGYVSLSKVGPQILNITATLEPDYIKSQGGPYRTVATILSDSNCPIPPELREANWRWTPLLSQSSNCLGVRRLLIIGDAAGFVEPFLGDGMACALGSAQALVAIVLSTLKTGWHDELPEIWTDKHANLVNRHWSASRRIALLLRDERMTRRIVAGLSVAPVLARPLLSHIHASFN